MTPLQIDKLLDVSTCHITQADSEKLAQDAREGDTTARRDGLPLAQGAKVPPFIVYEYAEGFRVWTGFDDEEYLKDTLKEGREAGYSEALLNLIKVASDNECRFLLLDRDGQNYEQFPEFDW